MKTGRTLTEVAAQIERDAKLKRDFVAPGTAVTMVLADNTPDGSVKPSLTLDGLQEMFGITKLAHQQVAQRLDIPRAYYDRMAEQAPALLVQNVNRWMRESKAHMVRTLDGSARAFLSERYRPIDNFPVAEVALETLSEVPEMRIESCEVTETRFYLKATFPRLQGEVRKGDVVQAGLLIQNSEVGAAALSIMPMTMRLVCLNGAVHSEFGQRRNHVGRRTGDEEVREFYADDTLRADDTALLLKVRDSIRMAVTETGLQRIIAQMRQSTEDALPAEPEKVVEVTAKQYGLIAEERTSVLRHLLMGGEMTRWGLANAVTRASQDVQSYDRATELERLGGRIIEVQPTEWREIRKMAEAA